METGRKHPLGEGRAAATRRKTTRMPLLSVLTPTGTRRRALWATGRATMHPLLGMALFTVYKAVGGWVALLALLGC